MLVFIHANFKLDLTYLNVTFTEINQWFKDDFSTENSIPFDLYLDSELSKNSGFRSHYNTNQNETIFSGYLDNDGELKAAVLQFISIKGSFISALIKSGTENFPSFDKKLSELNLEVKLVDNIVTDAVSVIFKGYPETNYNYPMVHTDKYDPTSDEWHGFEKTINKFVAGQFLTNALDLNTNIDSIRNIMQPLPYLMHVIKTGVADAGFTLAGDILQDRDLQQALPFRDGEYYLQQLKNEIPIVVKNKEWSSIFGTINRRSHVNFNKQLTIEKKGDYILFGTIPSIYFSQGRSRTSRLYISIETITSLGILQVFNVDYLAYPRIRPDHSVELSFDIDIPLSFNVGDSIVIKKTEVRRDETPSITPDYPEAVSLKLIPVRFKNPDGSPIISTLNLNEINLQKVVPDMTFRDLIMIIKNWKNYEFIPVDNVIYMNRISLKLSRDAAVDLSEFEVEEPERLFHEDRQFELSFTDGKAHETYKYDSLLVSKDNTVVNNYILKDTVNPIKIDALPLPVITRNGVTTALSYEDQTSKLRLVFMRPMIEGGAPITYWNENVLIPAVYENDFKEWLKFRINSLACNWDFIMSVEKFREITIQTLVYAYGNYHILSEIEKERLNSMFWRITAKTESLL